jgi:N-acetylneuraminic acid mutarotase
MVLARRTPLSVTLTDGSVFVVSETGGGFTSERLDPTTYVWKKTASLPPHARIDDMVGLSGGAVLAIGSDTGGGSEATPAAYRYDPASGTWTSVQGLAQSSVELVALPDGTALAIGGIDSTDAITAQVQRFDSRTGAWTQVAPLSTPRSRAQAVVLPDGRILVAGGSTGKAFASGTALRSTELYDPAADRWIPGQELLEARYGGQALALRDGSVMILGGANDFNAEGDTPWCPTPIVTTERLSPLP